MKESKNSAIQYAVQSTINSIGGSYEVSTFSITLQRQTEAIMKMQEVYALSSGLER